MKRIFFILALFSLFLIGCSTTPPTLKTQVNIVEPIGGNNKSSIVMETQGNITRIYSKQIEDK